jgi:hypothetical protein
LTSPHKRNPPKPSASRKELEAAQVKLIEAAGQVLLDQGWHVLVAGGLKIVRQQDEPTGVHWLCLKFTGVKRDAVQADDSAMQLLSEPRRSDSGKLRKEDAGGPRVGTRRKAR